MNPLSQSDLALARDAARLAARGDRISQPEMDSLRAVWEPRVVPPPSERADQLGKNVTTKRDEIDHQVMTWVDVKGYAVHIVSRPPDATALAKGFMPPLDLKKKPAKGGGGGIYC